MRTQDLDVRKAYGLALLILGASLLCAATLVAATASAQSVNVTATADTLCDDGIVQPPEECDGLNLNGASCSSLGYNAGTLSCASNCVFVTAQCTNLPPPNGGGGGGSPFDLDDLEPSLIVSGRAYPFATIVISEGNAVRASVSANDEADFQVTFNTNVGLHSFSVYGVDSHGRRSQRYDFNVTVNSNIVNAVTGVFLPPTIELQRSTVNRGATLGVFGLTVPQGAVSFYIDSAEQSFASAPVKGDGTYSLALSTAALSSGRHVIQARTKALDGITSDLSQAIGFTVEGPGVCARNTGDLNCDGRVDLVDLSSLLYWWHTASAEGLAIADLNRDAAVDLVDLSVMLTYWTS